MGKVVKGITGAISKGIGFITGSNATKKAQEEQANQMKAQNEYEQQQAESSRQLTRAQALAAQAQVEGTMARDKAVAEAEAERQKAASANVGTADIELTPGATNETDAQGRRINVRERFMSNRGASSGINL
ncbi:hypothetical protein LAh2_45 [Aeromonas phage LAh2]|uniref:Uncharacterized protein n=1 Tax=Aeromonas phage LAh1 TaxID=2591024 RepID=A0A513ZZ17_9CAUD|nr:hypothetical protein LAh1_45 [Aeromonas phage LAh1]QDH46310.1 hypothetical protein LAh2_45 [Aeromonas phage LAh2]QDH46354.1 hypothetical protein LAh3_50 [Aeromonas phage LAh3]QDH46404.1 hypothetical protein LAh4_52 [Aeromonas phage LAh4]QDH46457.1 hypothetical protein LAh5_54 [Aeromonas phage LAh5]